MISLSSLQFSDGNCEGGVLRLRGAIEIHQLHFWKLLQNPVRQAPRQRFAHTHDALQTTQCSAVQHQFQHRRCNDLSTSYHSSVKRETLSGRIMWASMFAKYTILYMQSMQSIKWSNTQALHQLGGKERTQILSKESMLTQALEWKPRKAVTGLWKPRVIICTPSSQDIFGKPYHIPIRAKDAYCWSKFLQVGVDF